MKPLDLLAKAHRHGLRLEPKGDRLSVTPADRVTPELRAELLAHKAVLLAWLSSPPCPGWKAIPPDNLPLVPVETRPTAEAREVVIAFLARQCGEWRNPGPLCAWLGRRENAYFDGPGRQWDCAAYSYAAARDAACWQLNSNEAQLLDTLAAFDEVAATKPTP